MHRSLIRRLIAGSLLLWLGLLQFPLQLCDPVDASKDLSVPFPCMHRACGCASAKECWTSCCCTTKEERIAIARKHLGYVPPELAEANDKTACTRHSCCSKKAPAKPHSSMVILSAALECKGIAAGWSVFSIAVPATRNTPQIVTVCTLPGQAVLTLDTIAESPAFDPLTPPPRSGCCATASI